MLVEITGANKEYISKKYERAFNVHNLKVLSTCLVRGMMFENVGFLRDQISSPVFREICRDR